MAIVNDETLQAKTRTQFFVKTAQGGLRQLPFELITIDHDFQAYELVTQWHDASFEPRQGVLTPPVILDREYALPRPVPPNKTEEWSVFEYHGI